jgi:SAM-dependent methyltransferase
MDSVRPARLARSTVADNAGGRVTVDPILSKVCTYYAGRLAAHGCTPKGVDWNDAVAQELRFRKLAALFVSSDPFSINDIGCGYAALVAFLDIEHPGFRYCGYDVSDAMVARARNLHTLRRDCRFETDIANVTLAEYSVASGIFNVKLDATTAAWEEHLHRVLDTMHDLSTRGFAFNALTMYSDPSSRRPELYYADPCRLFHRCQERYSRHVTLVHDYGLYDFTIIVRKVV